MCSWTPPGGSAWSGDRERCRTDRREHGGQAEAQLEPRDLCRCASAERLRARRGEWNDGREPEGRAQLGRRGEQSGGEALVGRRGRRRSARGRGDRRDPETATQQDEAAQHRRQGRGVRCDRVQRQRTGGDGEEPTGHGATLPDRRRDSRPRERPGDNGQVERREQQAGGDRRETQDLLGVQDAQQHRWCRGGGEHRRHRVRSGYSRPAQQGAVEDRVGGTTLYVRERSQERDRHGKRTEGASGERAACLGEGEREQQGGQAGGDEQRSCDVGSARCGVTPLFQDARCDDRGRYA